MQTIPCPGCRTDLDPAATVCPICLRPRTKLEITRAFATLREMEKQRKRRPFVITGRILAAAVLGAVCFRFHGPILGALSTAAAFGSKTVNDVLYPPSPAPAASPPPVAPAPSPAAPSSAPSSPRPVQPAATAPPAPEAASPDAAAAPPPPKRKAKRVEDLPFPPYNPETQWVFYGRAYDLITLQPVDNAQLNINALSGYQRTGTGIFPHTDSEGRFAVTLQRLPEGNSYEIRASRAGYATSALYEPDIPYATLPLADRREIARSAQDGDMTLPPLTDGGESSVRRDVFLAPAR